MGLKKKYLKWLLSPTVTNVNLWSLLNATWTSSRTLRLGKITLIGY